MASEARWDDDGDTATAPGADTPAGGLFLRGILDSALPHELGTDAEPERYTVAAIFSRQVAPEERALIEGPDARSTLAARGYPGVGLKVADRRLEISGTTWRRSRAVSPPRSRRSSGTSSSRS